MTPSANGYPGGPEQMQARPDDHKQRSGSRSSIPSQSSTNPLNNALDSSPTVAAEQPFISLRKPFREPESARVFSYLRGQAQRGDAVEKYTKVLVAECTAGLRDMYKADPPVDELGEIEQASPLGSAASDNEVARVGGCLSGAEAIDPTYGHAEVESSKYNYVDKDYVAEKADRASHAPGGVR